MAIHGRCWVVLLLLTVLSPSFVLTNVLTAGSTDEAVPFAKHTLLSPLIMQEGTFIACSAKNIFAFDRNGSLVWVVPLNYFCREGLTPITDDRGKIYLVAENRVLKISPSKIGSLEAPFEIFFTHDNSSEEIIGISISISYSVLFVTIQNRGLFSFLLKGDLQWSVGPTLYRYGYRQGCQNCYFNSVPVVDQCEGTIYVSSTEGQIYSLYIRNPQFRWIQNLGSFGNLTIITSGNNGIVYVTFPKKAVVIGLDASSGNITWQQLVGPLRSENSSPVVDSNGWISIGSLDGTLYSISPKGEMKKLLEKTASNSVIQASPVPDCTGFAVYTSQTEMDSKLVRNIGGYDYVSAMRPVRVLFTLLAPATGTVYWTGEYPGEVSNILSKSDLQYFAFDEKILLAFLSATRLGNMMQCYTTRQRIAWTCSQSKLKFVSTNSRDDDAILLFLIIQTIVLLVLVIIVRFCCVFWRKTKLQSNGLSGFLEKRRSLHSKRKKLNKIISELEQEAIQEATTSETLEKLGEKVKQKQGVERKLATSYSLGRDQNVNLTKSGSTESILPMYNEKMKSHSFHNSSKKESITIFETFSDSSSFEDESESGSDYSTGTSSSRSEDEIEMKQMKGKEISRDELEVVESSRDYSENETNLKRRDRRMGLKRRTLSSTN